MKSMKCMKIVAAAVLLSTSTALNTRPTQPAQRWTYRRAAAAVAVQLAPPPGLSLDETPELRGAASAQQQQQQQQQRAQDAPLLTRFLSLFQGHFDNEAQVAADTAAGRAPREGGGHEHIHCRLQPVELAGAEDALVLASYYFNGQPDSCFRARLYTLRELSADEQFGRCVEMSILRLDEEREAELRAAGFDADAASWAAADLAPQLRIPECDVYFRWCGERFEGRMRTDSIVVDSPVLKKPVVVRDDVALWSGGASGDDALWVNDRGHDLEGNYIYGNIHDVPYKMRRVPSTHWTATGGEAP